MSDIEADYGSLGTGNGLRPWPRGVSMSDIEADYGSLGTGNGLRPWPASFPASHSSSTGLHFRDTRRNRWE